MKYFVLLFVLTALLASSVGFAQVYWSRTCFFTHGPKAGTSQYFPFANPVPVGGYCQDGWYSWGYAIFD